MTKLPISSGRAATGTKDIAAGYRSHARRLMNRTVTGERDSHRTQRTRRAFAPISTSLAAAETPQAIVRRRILGSRRDAQNACVESRTGLVDVLSVRGSGRVVHRVA